MANFSLFPQITQQRAASPQKLELGGWRGNKQKKEEEEVGEEGAFLTQLYLTPTPRLTHTNFPYFFSTHILFFNGTSYAT